MISNIALIDCCEDEWTYQLVYNNQKYEKSYPLPFEEMAPLERTRFISEMYSPAFYAEQFKTLDARPGDAVEDYLMGSRIGYDPDEEEEEEEEFTPEGGVGQYLMDTLQDILDRLKALESPRKGPEETPGDPS